jgi:hypothetical protein
MALMDTANEGDEDEDEQWEGWLQGFDGMVSWGAVLPGSHLLVRVGDEKSIVISVQMLLGLGDRKRGNRTIADFIQMSNKPGSLALRLQQLLGTVRGENQDFEDAHGVFRPGTRNERKNHSVAWQKGLSTTVRDSLARLLFPKETSKSEAGDAPGTSGVWQVLGGCIWTDANDRSLARIFVYLRLTPTRV